MNTQSHPKQHIHLFGKTFEMSNFKKCHFCFDTPNFFSLDISGKKCMIGRTFSEMFKEPAQFWEKNDTS